MVDPRDNTELSMDEAINRGFIDQVKGIFKNAQTGEEYPIPVAMSMGYIKGMWKAFHSLGHSQVLADNVQHESLFWSIFI